MSSSNIIGMPRSDEDFEEKCVSLFANVAGDPNFKRVATSGKNQEGIDLIGSRDRDAEKPVGVQCKLRTKGHKLSEGEVRSDVERALNIKPSLTEIYVVTTADDDLAYDKLALTLRREQNARGRKVDIQIWGWGELQRRIRNDPDALRAFDPNYSASTNILLEQTSATLTAAETGAEMTSVVMSQQAKMSEHLAQLVAFHETGPQEQLNQFLDEQLNHIRELLNTGRPATARSLLENLESSEAVRSASIKARLKGYLGFAHLKSGNEREAAELFLEAYRLKPDDSRNKANRVLALVLQRKYKLALDAARQALGDDDTNASAAAFAYQSAALSRGTNDPDSFVPEGLKSDENVAFHRINFLRCRSDQWQTAAQEAHEENPTSRILGRLAAEALLDKAFNRESRTPGLTGAERTDALESAVALLQPYWNDVRLYENASEQGWLGVGLNLATAYRALHDMNALRRVTGELVALAPHDDDVLVAAAHLDLLDERPKRAVDRLSTAAESPHRTMVLLLAYAEDEQWEQLLEFATEDRLKPLDTFDRDIAVANVLRAKLELSEVEQVTKVIEEFVKTPPDRLPSAVTVAEFAHRFRHASLDTILDQAVALLDGADLRDRFLYAEICERCGRFERLIQALDWYIDVTEPSDPLAWLALAFANAPTRPRTHAFFASLPQNVIKRSRFARLAAAAENARGDLKEAERHARAALADDSTDLRTHLLLQIILERSNRRNQAAAAIRSLDENAVIGSPLDRMHLAMLLRRHGEGERATALGFKIASTHRGDEEIVSKYPSLIFFNEDLPDGVATSGTIQDGYWFSLDGMNAPSVSGIISSEQIPGTDNYSPDHPVAKAIIGKSVGDEILLQGSFGPDRRYIIKEIKHRYIWLLHDITRSHAIRFPDSSSMMELTIADGDIQPVLDVARQSSERQKAILDAYNSQPLPLEALAGIFHKSVLEIAELVAQLGGTVHTCIGTEEERHSALLFCKKAAGKGAVLDTLTAWTVSRLGLLQTLKKHFGTIAIAQSTIDEFVGLREREELNVGREYMTLGFQGDQAVRQIHAPEETDRRIQIFNTTIEALQSHCDVLPVEGSDDIALTHLLDEKSMRGMLDPILLARQHRYLLLSDDLHIRQLAYHSGVRHSAWVQAFAMMLQKSGAIDLNEYARITSRLALWKHDHVALDSATLIDILQFEEHADPYFDASTEFIGGEKADVVSHIGVVSDFINDVWSTPIESWRKGRAAGRMLWQLLKGRKDWRKILGTLIAVIPRRPQRITSRQDLSLEYVRDWVVGHFLQPNRRPKRTKRERR